MNIPECPLVTMQSFYEVHLPVLTPSAPRSSASVLTMVITRLQVRATHQSAARHDDLRAERLSSLFVRDAPKIGMHGSSILCNVTNGGKTNANGNIIYSGTAPHRNPLLCSIFARGCMLLTRWNVVSASSHGGGKRPWGP